MTILSEYEEQKLVVAYLELKELKFTSIPNSTFTKSWKQKMKNKQEGLRPGLPDLLIIVPNGLLFIEMKKLKGGKVSDHQKGWIEALNKISHVEAVVCKGAEEAFKTIDRFI